MKKSVLKISLCVLVLLTAVFAYSACTKIHSHVKQTVVVVIKEPTCTETGLTKTVCQICNKVLEEKDIKKLSHDYIDSVTTPSTCSSTGLLSSTCRVCGDVKTAVIHKLAHEYDDGVVTPPTDNEDGYTTYTCKNCSFSYKDDIVPATNPTRYSITYVLDGGINSPKNPETYTIRDVVTLSAPTKDGYHSLHWYTDEACQDKDQCDKISAGTTKNIVLYAKWEEHEPNSNCRCSACGAAVHKLDPDCKCEVCKKYVHTPGTDCTCIACGAVAHAFDKNGKCENCGLEKPLISGKKVTFGSYPQSKVTDTDLIAALNGKAGTVQGQTPTCDNANGWTSYGYYVSDSDSTDYMWYIDIEEGTERYRGVYFTSYRPYYTIYDDSLSNTYQDDNGYTTSTMYWFRYDPLTWTILSQSNGKALILCDYIIDAQQYDYDGSYSNNYAESTIRKWLNDEFLNTAFTAEQIEAYILTTTVDNSERSTNPSIDATQFHNGINSFACADTEDKVFLLSEQEVTNNAYGYTSSCSNSDTARRKKTTTYAQVHGGITDTSKEYNGNGWWWLRSPSYGDSYTAHIVYHSGYADVSRYVYYTCGGIVPAMQISIE